jgi:hypothetical protein
VIRAFELGADPDDQDSLDGQKAALTYAMWATFVPMGLLGAWVSHLRLSRFMNHGLQCFRCGHCFRDQTSLGCQTASVTVQL